MHEGLPHTFGDIVQQSGLQQGWLIVTRSLQSPQYGQRMALIVGRHPGEQALLGGSGQD
jgi:hypothetical protein